MTDFLENVRDIQDEDSLRQVSRYAFELSSLRKRIDLAEEKLKELKKEELKLSNEEIPDLLLSMGLTSISLDSGEKITIEENLHVSLPKKDLAKKRIVLIWIIENGGADMIKKELIIDEPEKKIIDYLKETHIPFKQQQGIHPSTLKAFFKSKLGITKGSLQEIEVGDVPEEANLYVYKETKIK